MKSFALTRREFHRLMLAAGAGFFASPPSSADGLGSPFVHPGLLHSATDLDRMRNAVRAGRQPIAAGFEKLREHPLSSAAYAPHRAAEEIGRNPNVNSREFDADASAAYQCALMAGIAGDKRYSALARQIVLGWSASLQSVSGADAVLMAGLGPFKLVNAAEILRHLGELDTMGAASCAAMLRRSILPAIIDFAPFANGNWDTAAVKTMLAIAVFCDDRALFERALLYYLHGDGDGRLTHYIYENGQCQESGRDQQHTQLGLAHMGDACQIAWNQGWDLYGAKDNRLLRGFEYTAAYNLCKKVAFRPDVDRTGQYRHSAISPPGPLRPVYEQILAHYHMRRGLPAPAVQEVVEKIRPESAAHGADHTGFGTLLYARTEVDREPAPRLVPPVALHAATCGKAVELNWLPPRASAPAILARDGARVKISAPSSSYRDEQVARGRKYTYRLSASDPAAFTAAPVSIATGLPEGWKSAALGRPAVAGDVQFDGTVFTVRTAGTGLMQPADDGHFVAVAPPASDLTVRCIPLVASRFAAFGLAFRSGFTPGAPSLALLVMRAGKQDGQGNWRVRLLARNSSGVVTALSDVPLNTPVVTYGRLIKSVWLRLQTSGSLLQAAFSTDGIPWIPVGQSSTFGWDSIGFIAASGIPEISTAVRFEIAGVDRQRSSTEEISGNEALPALTGS